MASPGAAPAASHRRIGHKKSRLGCARCKARHVKCDEQAPCRNCVRHGLECSLVNSGPGSAATSHLSPGGPPIPVSRGAERALPSTSAHHPRSPLSQGPLQPLPPLHHQHNSHSSAQKPSSGAQRSSTLAGGNGYPDVLCSEPPGIYTPNWMQSLRLFHHFCQHTAYKMSSSPAMTDLWRKRIPDVACSHEFLMHGLLATSALHYARTNPPKSQEYSLVSTHYQTLALQSFTNRLSDMNEENVEAYFLLATFIFMLAIASISDPIARAKRATGPNDLAQSFVLLQGVKSILDTKAAEKFSQHDGPLAAMLHDKHELRRAVPSHVSPFTRRLDRLIVLARELESSLYFDMVNNPQTACILALESLRHTYTRCVEATSRTSSPRTTTGSGMSAGAGAGLSPIYAAGRPGGGTPSNDGGSPAAYTPPSTSTSNPQPLYSQRSSDLVHDAAEQGQRHTWLWPITLTQTFVQLVEGGNHMALIIVAHYAAMARPYEGPFWVGQGWSQSVLAIAEQHLASDKQHWIAWPKKSILEEINVDDMPEDV